MSKPWKDYLRPDEQAWLGFDPALDRLLQRLSNARWFSEKRQEDIEELQKKVPPEPPIEAPTLSEEDYSKEIQAAIEDHEMRGGEICDAHGCIWSEEPIETHKFFIWPMVECQRCGSVTHNYSRPLGSLKDE